MYATYQSKKPHRHLEMLSTAEKMQDPTHSPRDIVFFQENYQVKEVSDFNKMIDPVQVRTSRLSELRKPYLQPVNHDTLKSIEEEDNSIEQQYNARFSTNLNPLQLHNYRINGAYSPKENANFFRNPLSPRLVSQDNAQKLGLANNASEIGTNIHLKSPKIAKFVNLAKKKDSQFFAQSLSSQNVRNHSPAIKGHTQDQQNMHGADSLRLDEQRIHTRVVSKMPR